VDVPRTAAEIAAGVTPTNVSYPVGNVLRYGADPSGVAGSSAALMAAGNSFGAQGGTVFLPAGTYSIPCGNFYAFSEDGTGLKLKDGDVIARQRDGGWSLMSNPRIALSLM
jgi:hypothetical protein